MYTIRLSGQTRTGIISTAPRRGFLLLLEELLEGVGEASAGMTKKQRRSEWTL